MSKRVIVIEDDEDVFELLRVELEARECAVTKVSVATVAEAVVALQDYDFFVVDLGLVGGDGHEVLTAINKAHPDAKEKIIVHTAAKLNDQEVFELEKQCAAVVPKSPESVLQIVELSNL